jgi:hypothetical protein
MQSEFADAQRRLQGASSVVGVVGQHVADLTQLPAQDSPDWLRQLQVSAGWLLAHLDGRTCSHRESRCAINVRAADGCETTSSSAPACHRTVLSQNTTIARRAILKQTASLRMSSLRRRCLAFPFAPAVAAATHRGRSPDMAQYSTYLAHGKSPGQGRRSHSAYSLARTLGHGSATTSPTSATESTTHL